MAKDKLISPSFCYILAANFLLFFAFYLILPILPFYLQDQFDADKSMIGFILSCYTIAALCIRPFSGYLLDTFARRPLYLLAYSVFMVIFAGYMIASLLSIFIVLRFRKAWRRKPPGDPYCTGALHSPAWYFSEQLQSSFRSCPWQLRHARRKTDPWRCG